MLNATDLFHCMKISLILMKIEDFGVTSWKMIINILDKHSNC